MEHLRAIIVTKTHGTLTTQSVRPEATEVNVSLGHPGVGHEKPGTEDGLGEDVQNSISDDFSIDRHVSGAISNSPDTMIISVQVLVGKRGNSHWVGSPDDNRKACNGQEEGADLVTLSLSLGSAVDSQVPDDHEVGDASDGVPAPLLGGTLTSESGEQTGQDHDDVRNDSHGDMSTIEASQQAEVEEEQRCGQSPVNIAGPVDLAMDLSEGIRNVVVLVADGDLVDRDTVTGRHGKV
jgi:hypothetical protein